MSETNDELRDHDGRRGGHLITADCPLDCLAFHISAKAFNPLASELPWLLKRRVTVGDVADMQLRRQLRHIRHLGPRRIGEIELILILTGLISAPRDPPGTAAEASRS